MLDKHVVFFERAFIQKHINPLARGQLALGMLRGNPLFTAAEAGLVTALFELVEYVLHVKIVRKFFGAGRLAVRPATDKHRLAL
jgi:hypothetical protein